MEKNNYEANTTKRILSKCKLDEGLSGLDRFGEKMRIKKKCLHEAIGNCKAIQNTNETRKKTIFSIILLTIKLWLHVNGPCDKITLNRRCYGFLPLRNGIISHFFFFVGNFFKVNYITLVKTFLKFIG